MLAEIQRLRYDVYCVERGFLDGNAFPDDREWDAFDEFAIHLVATGTDGQVTGTARLVVDSPLGFPLEERAGGLGPAFDALPRHRTAEISRLVVAKSRRHVHKSGRESGRERVHPVVLFKVFREICIESRRAGLHYWLAAMEPSLQRLIRRCLGFEFVQIGEPIEYYGTVVPYMASIADFRATLLRDRPDIFEYFGYGDELRPEYHERIDIERLAYGDDRRC